MQITQLHHNTFDSGETILCVTTLNTHQWVMLLGSGNVYKWDAIKKQNEYLFNVNGGFTYKDGGFDRSAKCVIYAMDEVVVVVNEFKTHGFVFNPKIGRLIQLWREDYHAENSPYPIALYKNEDGIPHLIYAVAWNHLQIMNLDTRQILTADKSLVEVNAEQSHIDFYKEYKDENKLPWPTSFDYFFAQILLSPDNTKFLSRGWRWGSADVFRIFDLNHFLDNNRISYTNTFGGEHLNRPACWIDNYTIAVAAYPYRDDDEALGKSTHVIIMMLDDKEAEKRFLLHESEELVGELYFNAFKQLFIFIDKNFGTRIFDLEGKMVFKDENFKPNGYNNKEDLFTCLDNKIISVHHIS